MKVFTNTTTRIRTIVTATLLVLLVQVSACAQEKPIRMIPGPSEKELVPESNVSSQDGISRIIFAQLFTPGKTEYRRVGENALKYAPPLPTGYTLYKERVYDVKTDAVITSALNITVFNIPSAENEEEFKKLAILHLEDDELSPSGRSWSDLTLTTGRWDKDLSPFVSEAQYNSLVADFKSRRVAAISNEFGIFAIAFTPKYPGTSTGPFSRFDVTTPSSSKLEQADQEITHIFTIKNLGPKAAAEVSFKEELGAYLEFVSAIADGGSCKRSTQSSSRILCYLGTLPVSGSVTIKVTSRLGRNVVWTRNEIELGNVIEIAFKENPTDFVEADNQFTAQFTTRLIKN